ncbi:vWA-MoxR associated conflict system protein [Streptomyces avermitilis]|uniref:vWA-MoxR associated conflict system protein n=1 Tax=Streptomyces avermitilis TaxID=33903 RepID=UPI00370FD7EE
MSGPRHVLVIGAQCPALGLLPELEQAARSLHDTLTAPWAGACEKDHPERTTLRCGADVTQAEVERAVREAGRHAAAEGAVLVVALLGHGMPGGTSLYFAAGDSEPENPTKMVDVGSLLSQLLDTPGLDGVIAVVDTCYAGNAAPDLKSLAGGIREGDTRLALLMGAGAKEEAYGLRFSRTLVKVLGEGIDGAGETLSPAAVADAVRIDGGAEGQAILRTEFDGAQLAQERLWLARNARHSTPTGPLLGPVGAEELARALERLGGDPASSGVPHPAGVTGLRDLDSLKPALSALPSSAERAWALGVLDALRDAVRTTALLTAWPGADLTTPLLRRTLAVVSPASTATLPESRGTGLLRDAVEHLLLRSPRAGQRRTVPLADFVAALARETDVDPGAPELRRWAADLDAEIDLNDAFVRHADRTRDMRLRLVVSLHSAVGDDWPESLAAWLLDGDAVRHHEEFPCAPDRTGVEGRLGAVLRWASRHARVLGAPLYRVEIAAPAPLLVQWRPEETDFGMRLGADHDVVLRWSDRIQPPDHLWWINDRARKALEAMQACPDGTRADWLGESDTRQFQETYGRLMSGPRTRAVALTHRPSRLKDMMERLLAASPIVLWPDDEASVPDDVRAYLDTHWHLLPTEFCRAYRDKWSTCGDPAGATSAAAAGRRRLAGLRTVWDGPEWLEFCTWFEREQFTHEAHEAAHEAAQGQSATTDGEYPT